MLTKFKVYHSLVTESVFISDYFAVFLVRRLNKVSQLNATHSFIMEKGRRRIFFKQTSLTLRWNMLHVSFTSSLGSSAVCLCCVFLQRCWSELDSFDWLVDSWTVFIILCAIIFCDISLFEELFRFSNYSSKYFNAINTDVFGVIHWVVFRSHLCIFNSLLCAAIELDNIDATEIVDISYINKAARLLEVSLRQR